MVAKLFYCIFGGNWFCTHKKETIIFLFFSTNKRILPVFLNTVNSRFTGIGLSGIRITGYSPPKNSNVHFIRLYYFYTCFMHFYFVIGIFKQLQYVTIYEFDYPGLRTSPWSRLIEIPLRTVNREHDIGSLNTKSENIIMLILNFGIKSFKFFVWEQIFHFSQYVNSSWNTSFSHRTFCVSVFSVSKYARSEKNPLLYTQNGKS